MSITKIITNTHATEENGCPKEPSTERALAGYCLVKANINFLGEAAFADGKLSSQDLHNLKHQSFTTVKIHNYSDVKELRDNFNFFKHGFEYCKIKKESPLSRAIEQYTKDRLANTFFGHSLESQLSDQVQQFLSSWGQKNGILGIPVLVNNRTRRSDHNSDFFEPTSYVHVDFCSTELTNHSSHVRNVYKQGTEEVFGKMSDEDYNKFKHHCLANVWIPLHNMPSHNTLAVMNTNSVQDIQKKLRLLSIDGGISFGIQPDQEQIWVTKENLTHEDRLIIIFNTTLTPHTAINIEGVPESPRMSIEFRADFVTPQ